jgi:hypothetical protein
MKRHNIILCFSLLAIFQGLSILAGYHAYGQQTKRKNIFPIWTYHQKNRNIHGISLGLITPEKGNSNTNGIKIELIGLGLALLLIPRSPIAENDAVFTALLNDSISEKINGIALSASGTACNSCVYNGATIGGVGQVVRKVNGFSAVFFMNFTQIVNGLQMGILNDNYYLRGMQLGGFNLTVKAKGVQIGLLNKAKEFNGLQIGLWNVNQRRKLPIINWNFKKLEY